MDATAGTSETNEQNPEGMTLAEALRVLELSADATPAEVNSQFRLLALELPGDLSGVAAPRLNELLRAREVALESRSNLGLMAPVPSALALPGHTPNPAPRPPTPPEVIDRIVRTQGGRFQALSRASLALSGLSAFLTLVSGRLDDAMWFFSGQQGYHQAYHPFEPMLVFFLWLFGLGAGVLTLASRAVRQSIQDASSTLDDRQTYLDLWSEMHLPVDEGVTRSEMQKKVRQWSLRSTGFAPIRAVHLLLSLRLFIGLAIPLHELCRFIGMDDFLKLLWAKGQELGLLEAHVERRSDRYDTIYCLAVPHLLKRSIEG